MNTSLIFAGETRPSEPREVVKKAVAFAEGAKTETESRLLNALRKQRFSSAGSLAAYVKVDDGEVRDTLTTLIGRGLVEWISETISSSGAGYRAKDFKSFASAASASEVSRKASLKATLGL